MYFTNMHATFMFVVASRASPRPTQQLLHRRPAGSARCAAVENWRIRFVPQLHSMRRRRSAMLAEVPAEGPPEEQHEGGHTVVQSQKGACSDQVALWLEEQLAISSSVPLSCACGVAN